MLSSARIVLSGRRASSAPSSQKLNQSKCLVMELNGSPVAETHAHRRCSRVPVSPPAPGSLRAFMRVKYSCSFRARGAPASAPHQRRKRLLSTAPDYFPYGPPPKKLSSCACKRFRPANKGPVVIVAFPRRCLKPPDNAHDVVSPESAVAPAQMMPCVLDRRLPRATPNPPPSYCQHHAGLPRLLVAIILLIDKRAGRNITKAALRYRVLHALQS